MKVKVTALKAPWPDGVKVGDVVSFDALPAWAVGKCVQAPDDAEVTAAVEAPAAVAAPDDADAAAERKPKGKPKG